MWEFKCSKPPLAGSMWHWKRGGWMALRRPSLLILVLGVIYQIFNNFPLSFLLLPDFRNDDDTRNKIKVKVEKEAAKRNPSWLITIIAATFLPQSISQNSWFSTLRFTGEREREDLLKSWFIFPLLPSARSPLFLPSLGEQGYKSRRSGGPHSTLLALLTAKQDDPGSSPDAIPPKRERTLFKNKRTNPVSSPCIRERLARTAVAGRQKKITTIVEATTTTRDLRPGTSWLQDQGKNNAKTPYFLNL